MDTLEKIESELKEISKWPWQVGQLISSKEWSLGLIPTRDTEGDNLVCLDPAYDWQEKIANRVFIALAPERIAALVEYVRANEEYLRLLREDVELDTMPDVLKRLEQARAKLGLK